MSAAILSGFLTAGVTTAALSGFRADALSSLDAICRTALVRVSAVADSDDVDPTVAPPAKSQNIYAAIAASAEPPGGTSARIFVPNVASSTIQIIDPARMQVIARHRVDLHPHHIVLSHDLKTLWVTSVGRGRNRGSVTPIDAQTGKIGARIAVDDPYNMYFSMDGKSAIIVAEDLKRLDFRDPQTMRLQYSIPAPGCGGINHADFSPDGATAIFTCEYSGSLVKIDMTNRTVVGYLALEKDSMPQDIRSSPDGTSFYVADMRQGGVHVIDTASFERKGFIKTGTGAHGLYPSRDGLKLYVANRGTSLTRGKRREAGSVSVIDFASSEVQKHWPVRGGGSPDMGALSADGKTLWLSGRFDDVVYAIDTDSGDMRQIKVDGEPHGLTIWPQAGSISLGHTGNMR